MNKYPIPSDERLEQLICESFECMPGPDMQRLHQLEQRLARIPAPYHRGEKPNTLPWWIVLLAAGSFAAAAWWAGEKWSGSPKPWPGVGTIMSDREITGGNNGASRADSEKAQDATAEQQVEERSDSPVIYLRENL